MKPKKLKSMRAWAPDIIFLTRDGWNDTFPEDGEILWCEDRITKKDVKYRRVYPITPLKRRGK